MTRKGSQVQVLYGPPGEPQVRGHCRFLFFASDTYTVAVFDRTSGTITELRTDVAHVWALAGGRLEDARLRCRVTLRSQSSTPEEADMGVFNGAFPILAGKEEDARAFAAETFGARRPDFEAHLARVGVTRETWALQETPM